MKRALCLFVLLAIFTSCGGEIDTTEISKVAVVTFDAHPGNIQSDSLILREDTDIIRTEFEEFIESLKSVRVNNIQIQIIDLPSSGSPRLASLSLGVDRNLVDSANVFSLDLRALPDFTHLPITNNALEIVNTEPILIYERNTGRGVVTDENEGVKLVLSLIENLEPMQMGVGLLFLDDLNSQFRIEVSFDITVEVNLN